MVYIPKQFEPYYDRVLQATVTSQRQKERLMKAHRSKAHPMGIYDIRDDKKFLAEQANIQRHREDFKAQMNPGYRARTQREIEKYGERRIDADRPDADRVGRTKYFHS